MSDIELALIFTVIIVIVCSGFLAYFAYDILPERLWMQFKLLQEKETEKLRCQQFDREREDFEAWKVAQKHSPPADKSSDSLDIFDDSNWAQ